MAILYVIECVLYGVSIYEARKTGNTYQFPANTEAVETDGIRKSLMDPPVVN